MLLHPASCTLFYPFDPDICSGLCCLECDFPRAGVWPWLVEEGFILPFGSHGGCGLSPFAVNLETVCADDLLSVLLYLLVKTEIPNW